MLSFLSGGPACRQVACGVTETNERTHAIIRENLHRSAMYGGRIEGVGPRYCPSIEDKVVRFADKASHQIFLEPEGLDTATVYPNGISTSLPPEVQEAYVRSIQGLEKADDNPAGLCGRVRLRRSPRAGPHAGGQGAAGAVPRRADQRDDGLRGGGRAGAGRRAQRGGEGFGEGAGRSRPGRGLHRGDGGRPRDAGGHRALPDVHVAGGVSPSAARGQCRPAADPARDIDRLRRGGPARGLREEAGGGGRRARVGWRAHRLAGRGGAARPRGQPGWGPAERVRAHGPCRSAVSRRCWRRSRSSRRCRGRSWSRWRATLPMRRSWRGRKWISGGCDATRG